MFHIRKQDINDHYYIDEDYIGEGGYALVKKAYSKSDNSPYAIKIYERCLMDANDEVNLQNEINILTQVDHPNIVKMYEVFQDSTHWYLVLQYMAGGQLFDKIVLKQHYTQYEAKQVLLPIIDAIRYLHDLGIVHRDLKPQNILYLDDRPNSVIKLSDFGVSKIITNNRMSTKVGTPSYFAPQILQGNGYTKAVDYWSIGILIYILLSGTAPFFEEDRDLLQQKISKGVYEFPKEDWEQLSHEAIDFIKSLLVVDPSKRLSASNIMNHPWLQKDLTKGELKDTQKNIKSYIKKLQTERPENIKKFCKHIEQIKEKQYN